MHINSDLLSYKSNLIRKYLKMENGQVIDRGMSFEKNKLKRGPRTKVHRLWFKWNFGNYKLLTTNLFFFH